MRLFYANFLIMVYNSTSWRLCRVWNFKTMDLLYRINKYIHHSKVLCI